MRVFQACRAYAHTIASRCYIMAFYENHERVGWHFAMPNEIAALRLRMFHAEAVRKPCW